MDSSQDESTAQMTREGVKQALWLVSRPAVEGSKGTNMAQNLAVQLGMATGDMYLLVINISVRTVGQVAH
jgi:hypothetical protein